MAGESYALFYYFLSALIMTKSKHSRIGNRVVTTPTHGNGDSFVLEQYRKAQQPVKYRFEENEDIGCWLKDKQPNEEEID